MVEPVYSGQQVSGCNREMVVLDEAFNVWSFATWSLLL